ncbi:hypothetical protein Tco_1195877, partial [Tanacetum coccineum]
VFNSPMLHLLRVEMVINSPWIMPLLGTKGLASPEQTATVGLSVAGSRFPEGSSMLLTFDVQVQQGYEDCKLYVQHGQVLDNESPTSASPVIADFARVHTSPSTHQKRSCQQTLLILSAVEEATFLQGANVNTVKNTSFIHNKVTTSAFSTTEDSEHAGTSASTHRKSARENIQTVSVACKDASSKRI